MDQIPQLAIDKTTLMLLGAWLFTAINFAKGKVWPNKFTTHVSLVAPFVLGIVPVWGGEKANLYVQVVAALFLMATGTWAVGKAAKPSEETK